MRSGVDGRSRLVFRWGALLSIVLIWADGQAAQAHEPDRYWSWGWGAYGLTSSALDNARFDWSLLTFGSSEAPDATTIARCDEILRLNPKHKFVIRVWPIANLGDRPENQYQATMFHYLYEPGTRERVLETVRTQLEFVLRNISNPESVVGATFLEELPSHFTSAPFGMSWANWKRGDPLPWDIQHFKARIEAELGESFNLRSAKHRRWWGRKYATVLGEIHRKMRSVLRDRLVLYYQQAGHPSMDYRSEGRPLKAAVDPMLVPIYYREIVGRGGADGVFGYPNNAQIWRAQTQDPVRRLGCLLFSQISIPGGMRLRPLEETTELARWRYRGNLGAFVFPSRGRKTRAWNEPDYQDESFWTTVDHYRRFAWRNRINLDVVQRGLSPVVHATVSRVPSGGGESIRVKAAVWNRRDVSWYGGTREPAVLRGVGVELRVPAGFSVQSAAGTANVADIEPQQALGAEWFVRRQPGATVDERDLWVEVIARAQDGEEGRASAAIAATMPNTSNARAIVRSGERWMELTDGANRIRAIELRPLAAQITSPSIQFDGTAAPVVYRSTLRPNTRLVLEPGSRARLYATDVFDEPVRTFAPHARDASGAAAFSEGYGVHATPSARVYWGETYRFAITGRASGGANMQVLARFSGSRFGVPVSEDQVVLVNEFDAVQRTRESTLAVPYFDRGEAAMSLAFYRRGEVGTVFYRSFEVRRSDLPVTGLDVSRLVRGELTEPPAGLSVWTYRDESDPDEWGLPKLTVRSLRSSDLMR